MRAVERYLAIDLGAESGRGFIGTFDGERLAAEQMLRFANVPVADASGLRWDVPALLEQARATIRRAARNGPLSSVAVDSWGVDFGLLDAAGGLVDAPFHYRDPRTEDAFQAALRVIPGGELYARTGVQLMRINTLFQLFAMVRNGDASLARATTLLLMPDLIHHALAGSRVSELTNASTTQCLDARTRTWATDLLERLEIPVRLLPPIVVPGTVLGPLLDDGRPSATRVVAPASHDTASAVAGTPLSLPSDAFVSSGTWSLVGIELNEPLITGRGLAFNMTNELGVSGTVRLLRNVMGLWLVQGLRRSKAAYGSALSYVELVARAERAAPFAAIIDPDDPSLLAPSDMAVAIRNQCDATGQPPPEDVGALARVALEGIALRSRWVIERLEQLSGRPITTIRVVGGGSRNRLLCQMTADATGRQVLAGPAEATALGNLAVQLMAAGRLAGLGDARAAIAAAFPPRAHDPVPDTRWEDAYARFSARVSRTESAPGPGDRL